MPQVKSDSPASKLALGGAMACSAGTRVCVRTERCVSPGTGLAGVGWAGRDHAVRQCVSRGSTDQTVHWIVPARTTGHVTASLAVAAARPDTTDTPVNTGVPLDSSDRTVPVRVTAGRDRHVIMRQAGVCVRLATVAPCVRDGARLAGLGRAVSSHVTVLGGPPVIQPWDSVSAPQGRLDRDVKKTVEEIVLVRTAPCSASVPIRPSVTLVMVAACVLLPGWAPHAQKDY